MNRAVTIGFPHSGPPKVILGPDVELDEHRRKLKAASLVRVNPTFARMEVWCSATGVVTSRKFLSPSDGSVRERTIEEKAAKRHQPQAASK